MRVPKKEYEESLQNLRKWIKPGATVYTILRKVSRSGMQREISLVVFIDGRPIHPNYATSKVTGYRLNRGRAHDSLIVKGCGMDMGYNVVDSLSRALGYGYNNETALKQEWL